MRLFPVLLLCFSFTALAGPPQPIEGGFSESVAEEVQTSGVFVVAVMAGLTERPTVPDEILIEVPETDDPRLCVFVRSIDSLYNAKAVFDISDTQPGTWPIQFDPDETGVVSDYAAEDLVIDSRLADDCAYTDERPQLVGSWVSAQDNPAGIRLYLNTDGNDAVVILPDRQDEDKVVTINCQRLQSDRRIRSFSTRCDIPSPTDGTLEGGWIELQRFGRVVDWEPLSIRRIAAQQE